MQIRPRRAPLFLGAVAFLLLASGPATADKPVRFQGEPAVFPALNPCTGEEHTVTIFFDVFLHVHQNRFLARVVRTGFTSDGYEMFAGTGLEQFNGNNFHGRFVDMWRSDDGQMFQARGNFIFNTNTGEVIVSKFALRCVGGDTVI